MSGQIKKITWLILLSVVLLTGCAGQQTRTKSSVVDYLYPKQSETVVQPSIPVLNIPLKVGVAFVPDQSKESRGFNFWSGARSVNTLTETKKMVLLERISEHFMKHKFVSEIEVIPSAYLTPGGSFTNLEQVKTMYGVDVIALVSYDQVQFTDNDYLSLTYWTLVGAYVVSGEKNDTSTLMDTAVYDIKSKKMLFRAPGTSSVKGSSTPINLSEQLRIDSARRFAEATENMVANLDLQLNRFRAKIKKNPEQVKVVYRKGYSGGVGSFGWIEVVLIMLASIVIISRRNRYPSA